MKTKKTISILFTILAFVGLLTVLLGLFVFENNILMFLGILISGSATITNWYIHKKNIFENKST